MRPEPRTLDTPTGSKPSLDVGKLPRDAWRPSEAAGQRLAPRTTEREIEMIPASIRSLKSPAWFPVRLWDYSLSGFGILYSSNSGHADFSTAGENVDLRLGGMQGFAAAGEKGIIIPCRIENSSRLEKGMRIGL